MSSVIRKDIVYTSRDRLMVPAMLLPVVPCWRFWNSLWSLLDVDLAHGWGPPLLHKRTFSLSYRNRFTGDGNHSRDPVVHLPWSFGVFQNSNHGNRFSDGQKEDIDDPEQDQDLRRSGTRKRSNYLFALTSGHLPPQLCSICWFHSPPFQNLQMHI